MQALLYTLAPVLAVVLGAIVASRTKLKPGLVAGLPTAMYANTAGRRLRPFCARGYRRNSRRFAPRNTPATSRRSDFAAGLAGNASR